MRRLGVGVMEVLLLAANSAPVCIHSGGGLLAENQCSIDQLYNKYIMNENISYHI